MVKIGRGKRNRPVLAFGLSVMLGVTAIAAETGLSIKQVAAESESYTESDCFDTILDGGTAESTGYTGDDADFVTEMSAQSSVSCLTVLPTDVETAGNGNVFIGIEGEYICEIQAALDLINSYRMEACEEGVINPSTGKALTMDDYVPIKWSSDLEYIARIRAAEASVTMDHSRLTSKSIWFSGPNGISSSGEVIAWNWSRTMTQGIKQWYGEKYDWVNNTGYVTGHYTQMIDPNNKYVGLATFYSESTCYPNTTAGEFCRGSGLDETKGESTGTIIQKLEASISCLSEAALTESSDKLGLTTAAEMTDYWGGTVTTNGLEILSGVEWSSSDTNVVAVDSSGNITKKSCGSATVSATFNGKTYEKSYTISHSYGSWETVKAATCTESGTSRRTCMICGNVESRTDAATGHAENKIYFAAKQATCVSEGNVEYYQCDKCGKNFSDAEGEYEITNVVTDIDSSNHVHTEVRNAVKPTSAEYGYTGDTYCSDCGKLLEKGKVLPILGDVNNDGKITAIDARLVLQAAAGNYDLGEYESVADVDGNGKVTAVDARMILQAAAGNIVF